jgi:hypothetical protein
MARVYDKINLPTNTTNIRTLAYYLEEISRWGVVHKQDEQTVYAKVKIESSRKTVTNPKTDTHTRQTLLLFGLIDVNEDSSIQVSALGQELLNYYENTTSFTEEDRISLMLKILFRWEIVDSKRNIHPGFLITKLLCDQDLNYYITNQELAEFVMNSDFISDQQYEDIKQYILNFRQSGVGISKYIAQTKATIFLATFVNNWGIFSDEKIELTNEQQKLGKRYSSGENVAEDDLEAEDTQVKREFLTINCYKLNPVAFFIAKIYISLLGGLKLNNYLTYFGASYKKSYKHHDLLDAYSSYLTALRTKPFMLLAGISGTGKSRIVREFAFKSCPPALQDAEGTTPGNYCMIEVKPNWHDSTEILGYYSNISKKYHFTKFVKFLVKAMMFPDVPFFVCLDEMNLAPVEQYFAEFLSVLETRKKDKETEVIQSGVLVAPEYFAPILNADSGNGYIAKYLCPEINVNIPHDIYTNRSLTTIGLTLPDNVFIIGTVNMDDTTHQFSRKVIDRAMTIEMNGGKLEDMFGHSADLQYLPEDQIMELSDFKPEYVNADEVMEAHSEYAETLQEKLVEKLDTINNCLKNTPFQVSYRVLNELCIYAGVLLDDGRELDNAISKAVDQITLMKILPRIEGDEDMFVTKDGNKLEQLQEILGKDSASSVKLEEMKERLKNSSFTRFWP